MKPCTTFEELLLVRLDSPLAPKDEASLQEHLAQCPACAQFATELEALGQLTAELPKIQPPDTLVQKLAEQDWSTLPQDRPKLKKQRRWQALAAGAAAVVILAVVGVTQLPPFSGADSMTQDTTGADHASAPGDGMDNGSSTDTSGSDQGSDSSTAAISLTQQTAAQLVLDYLEEQGRSLTLEALPPSVDAWRFVGRDASGESRAVFSVDQATGSVTETAPSAEEAP